MASPCIGRNRASEVSAPGDGSPASDWAGKKLVTTRLRTGRGLRLGCRKAWETVKKKAICSPTKGRPLKAQWALWPDTLSRSRKPDRSRMPRAVSFGTLPGDCERLRQSCPWPGGFRFGLEVSGLGRVGLGFLWGLGRPRESLFGVIPRFIDLIAFF